MTEDFSAIGVLNNTAELTLQVYPGADNTIVLYEDDNVSNDYQKGLCAKTRMSQEWSDGQMRFVIEPVEGETSLIPQERTFKIVFHKLWTKSVTVVVNGAMQQGEIERCGSSLKVTVASVKPADQVEILMEEGVKIAENSVEEAIAEILNRAEIEFELKDRIDGLVRINQGHPAVLFGELQTLEASRELCGAIMEIVGAMS